MIDFASPCPDGPMPIDQATALLERLEAATRACRAADLACARVLAELADGTACQALGCASVGELAERAGLSAEQARALLDLGRALRVHPTLEAHIQAGRISVASGAAVSVVLVDPALQRSEDDWIGWAQEEPTKSLRTRVRKRIEDVRCGGEATVPVSVFVKRQARDDFDRARQIASRKASRALTQGETFEVLVDHYLDTFDEDRVKAGARRCPPTAMVDGRYVPMSVRREIYDRQGHSCAVGYCGNVLFLERAHLWAHASGGDREADNLVLLCSTHHGLFDMGFLRMEGTAANPRFFDQAGNDLGRRYGCGPPAHSPPTVPPGAGGTLPPMRENHPPSAPSGGARGNDALREAGPSDSAPPPGDATDPRPGGDEATGPPS